MRSLIRWWAREPMSAPPFPEHYFSDKAARVAKRFVEQAIAVRLAGQHEPDFLEDEIGPELDNTWGDTAKAIINNWLGLVYQCTNLDRKKQFMSGVDPNDPLQLKSQSESSD